MGATGCYSPSFGAGGGFTWSTGPSGGLYDAWPSGSRAGLISGGISGRGAVGGLLGTRWSLGFDSWAIGFSDVPCLKVDKGERQHAADPDCERGEIYLVEGADSFRLPNLFLPHAYPLPKIAPALGTFLVQDFAPTSHSNRTTNPEITE